MLFFDLVDETDAVSFAEIALQLLDADAACGVELCEVLKFLYFAPVICSTTHLSFLPLLRTQTCWVLDEGYVLFFVARRTWFCDLFVVV